MVIQQYTIKNIYINHGKDHSIDHNLSVGLMIITYMYIYITYNNQLTHDEWTHTAYKWIQMALQHLTSPLRARPLPPPPLSQQRPLRAAPLAAPGVSVELGSENPHDLQHQKDGWNMLKHVETPLIMGETWINHLSAAGFLPAIVSRISFWG